MTDEQLVRAAIILAARKCRVPAYVAWASAWLDGSDRTPSSCRDASWAVYGPECAGIGGAEEAAWAIAAATELAEGTAAWLKFSARKSIRIARKNACASQAFNRRLRTLAPDIARRHIVLRRRATAAHPLP